MGSPAGTVGQEPLGRRRRRADRPGGVFGVVRADASLGPRSRRACHTAARCGDGQSAFECMVCGTIPVNRPPNACLRQAPQAPNRKRGMSGDLSTWYFMNIWHRAHARRAQASMHWAGDWPTVFQNHALGRLLTMRPSSRADAVLQVVGQGAARPTAFQAVAGKRNRPSIAARQPGEAMTRIGRNAVV